MCLLKHASSIIDYWSLLSREWVLRARVIYSSIVLHNTLFKMTSATVISSTGNHFAVLLQIYETKSSLQ